MLLTVGAMLSKEVLWLASDCKGVTRKQQWFHACEWSVSQTHQALHACGWSGSIGPVYLKSRLQIQSGMRVEIAKILTTHNSSFVG